MAMPTRRAGRPRDAGIDDAILDAAVEEMIDNGFLGLSMEAVAARAGVAKTTLYRRWSNTHDLGVQSLSRFESDVRPPPEGSVRDQLVCLVDAMRRKWAEPRYAALMRRVAADGNAQPELYRRTRDTLVRPYTEIMDAVLMRGVDEGIIRAGVDLKWVRQLLTSPIMAAALALRDRVTRAQVELTVDTVLAGLADRAG
jgi:AcrR family transcriptional regulator